MDEFTYDDLMHWSDQETSEKTNSKDMKCDFCPKVLKAGEGIACAWFKDECTGVICERCSDKSEAAYQASLMDVDYQESQLAEMEY